MVFRETGRHRRALSTRSVLSKLTTQTDSTDSRGPRGRAPSPSETPPKAALFWGEPSVRTSWPPRDPAAPEARAGPARGTRGSSIRGSAREAPTWNFTNSQERAHQGHFHEDEDKLTQPVLCARSVRVPRYATTVHLRREPTGFRFFSVKMKKTGDDVRVSSRNVLTGNRTPQRLQRGARAESCKQLWKTHCSRRRPATQGWPLSSGRSWDCGDGCHLLTGLHG